MSNVYSCVVCGMKLTPGFIGAAVRNFKHGQNNDCPNNQLLLPRGSDQVSVKDMPVEMIDRKLSYKRAGIVRYFQCNKISTHADYYRGEIAVGRGPIWKRCTASCDGQMMLTSVRLHPDGTIDPYVPYQRDPDAEPTKHTREYIGESKLLLKKYLRKVPRNFRRSKTGIDKSMELYLKGERPYRWLDKVKTRKVLVVADVETQTVSVFIYGCAGWASEFKRASNLTGIPADVIIKPAFITNRGLKSKGKK